MLSLSSWRWTELEERTLAPCWPVVSACETGWRRFEDWSLEARDWLRSEYGGMVAVHRESGPVLGIFVYTLFCMSGERMAGHLIDRLWAVEPLVPGRSLVGTLWCAKQHARERGLDCVGLAAGAVRASHGGRELIERCARETGFHPCGFGWYASFRSEDGVVVLSRHRK